METLQHLKRKLEGAADIKSLVKTMKTMAASHIGQYESAANSLHDYNRVVTLGIVAYFNNQKIIPTQDNSKNIKPNNKSICAIVFGSDQGLVGRFNDSLAEFVAASLNALEEKKEIWIIGERIQMPISDTGFNITELFSVPNSVAAITSLVSKLLLKTQENLKKDAIQEYYIFHNKQKSVTGYEPVMQHFLPLNERWRHTISENKWPTKIPPEIVGGTKQTLSALIREYIFATLFKACAESLVCENASRLAAMKRAEKNIDEMLNDLNRTYHSLRQSSIDEELFDVISGFETLKNNNTKKKYY